MATDELVPACALDRDRNASSRPEATFELRPIKALDQTVVNQIAAGEIIQRPANALKELIENSLDASSTSIKITLKEGGLKMLQVQDNGSGVRPEDLPLLCQRFATSKLREFSDLSNMTTFGFRGEALASLSFVCASMAVVSKTRAESCAYKAAYLNGALTPPKPGQPSAPRPCAGTDGTSITAESLFYNTPMRLRALRSASDEYNRCLDVVSKYAVHYGGRGVGFVCKKASSNAADLSTPSSKTTTTLDTIRALHGSSVAKELVRLKPVKTERLGFQVEGWISGANWSAKKSTLLCFINNRLVDCPSLKRAMEAMYSGLLPKGGHPWLYISLEIEPNRIDVNVHPTKREVHFLDEEEIVESVCTHAEACLAGANTSRTFKLTQALLPGASEPSSKRQRTEDESDSCSRPMPQSTLPTSSQRGYPQHLVRVDAKTRTLDSMFGFSASQSQSQFQSQFLSQSGSRSAATGPSSSRGLVPSSDPVVIDEEDEEMEEDEDEDVDEEGEREEEQEEEDSIRVQSRLQNGTGSEALDVDGQEEGSSSPTMRSSPPATQQRRPPPLRPPPATPASQPRQRVSKRLRDSECTLTSVRELRAEILARRHSGMTELFQGHTFVGVAALEHGTTLVQHGTRLYMLNCHRVIEEFAYQLVLRQFGSLNAVRLDPAPTIAVLVESALNAARGWEEAGLTRDDVVQRVESRVLSHAEMMAEYFSIRFDAKAKTLVAVPALLPLHGTAALQSQRFGTLLLRLATEVSWGEEKSCFRGIARELAKASVPCVDGLVVRQLGETVEAGDDTGADSGGEEQARDREEWDRQAWVVQHVWFAQMSPERCGFVAPKSLLEGGAVMQVANLPDLYRVFERC